MKTERKSQRAQSVQEWYAIVNNLEPLTCLYTRDKKMLYLTSHLPMISVVPTIL